MPHEIDTEFMESPSMQLLDIAKPPVRVIAHEEYPKALYLHPLNKAEEHRIQIVSKPSDENRLLEQGWKTEPHIPTPEPEDLSKNYEVRRGPGRPKAS